MPEVRVLTDVICRSGESPVWDVEGERFYWIDNAEGLVFRATVDGSELTVWPIPRLITSLGLRAGGGLVVTSGRRVLAFDLTTGDTTDLLAADARPPSLFNDGKVDRSGRFVTGTVDPAVFEREKVELDATAEPSGWLFRVEPDLALTPLVGGIGITNGPCFSSDGSTFYVCDSAARRIYAYDYDGVVRNRRVIAQFDGDSLPDGATVDEEDCIWVATFGGGEIRRYTPEGELDRRIPVPVDRPTSVMFGGAELDVLIVTSQGDGHASSQGPASRSTLLDGRTFAIHGLGVRGLPEQHFAHTAAHGRP